MRLKHSAVLKTGDSVRLWNIHGSTLKSKSIMLGLDHYCGYIGKIDGYIKGTYKFKKKGKWITIKPIENKLNCNEIYPYDDISWVELFFKSNIYFVGFGLEYNELDIWWILNKRARMKKSSQNGNNITNEIYFYCREIDGVKKKLLESFDVKVVISAETNYEMFYEACLNDIKSK